MVLDKKSKEVFLIEGVNIEYGKIENCKFDTKLTSKIWRRVISKKTTVRSKLASKMLTSTVKRGQTGPPGGSNGVIASPIIISRGAPPPPPHGDPV